MSAGPVMAFDLGRLCGVAVGRPAPGRPTALTVVLSKPDGGLYTQAGTLLAFMDEQLRLEKPSLVAVEAAFSLAAFSDHKVAEHVVRSAYGLHGVLMAACSRHDVPLHPVAAATVRKHFTGRASHGSRAATKRAVISRCRQLGYVQADCTDEDKCDALGIWDWACAHLARVPPTTLHMFGGAPS